jgi:hypothetical protein
MSNFQFKAKREFSPKQFTQRKGLHIMAGLSFLVTGISFIINKAMLPGIPYALAGAVVLVTGLFRNRVIANHQRNLYFRWLEVILWFGLASISFFWDETRTGVLMLLIAAGFGYVTYVERKYAVAPLIEFDNEGASVPFVSGRQTYAWNSMETVILHNGLLTINFKDNRLLQVDVEAVGAGIAEQFANFAKARLEGVTVSS